MDINCAVMNKEYSIHFRMFQEIIFGMFIAD